MTGRSEIKHYLLGVEYYSIWDWTEKVYTITIAKISYSTFLQMNIDIYTLNRYDYVSENDIRLAYMVSTSSSVVYVDAYTAVFVGGDIYKVVRGGATGGT